MRRAGARLWVASLALLGAGCSGLGKIDYTSLGRGAWQRPDDVVRALEIAPGSRVADLGAGEGYFVPYLLDATAPAGEVLAVDVEREVTDALAERFATGAGGRLEVILGEYDDPGLPDGAVDLVLLVNTYHHIEGRIAYFERLRGDLAPGGRVAVIEPNAELGGVLGLFVEDGHESRLGEVEAEMRAAGYRRVAEHDFLPIQIFAVFAARDEDAP